MNLRRPGPAAIAGALGGAGVLLRLGLLHLGYPLFDSDEAAMGLIARHMAEGRHFPVFLYGQQYMGTGEAILAVPLVRLFGPSPFVLRLPLLLVFALFLVALYRLARLIVPRRPWFAVLAVGLASLGSDRVLKDELVAHGGSPEIKVIAAVAVLLAVRLVGRPSTGGFALWGLVAGVGLWDHLLVAPFLAASGLILLLRYGRVLLGRYGLAVLAGLLLGSAPMIYYNLDATPGNDSLTILLYLNNVGPAVPLLDRLHGGIMLGVPLAAGVCSPSVCAPWQQAAGPLIVALLLAALFMAWRTYRSTARSTSAAGSDATSDQHRDELSGPLAAGALGALLSIAAYSRSPAAGVTPIESARYLSALPVALPAILWPLWTLAVHPRPDARPDVRPVARPGALRAARLAARASGLAALAALLVATALATATVAVRAAPDARASQRDFTAMVATLRGLGVTRVWSEYWTCNRISFVTAERTVCAVLDDDLTNGWDRYPAYRGMVARAGQHAYVLPRGTAIHRNFQAYLTRLGLPTRAVARTGGFDIYRFDTRSGVGVPLRRPFEARWEVEASREVEARRPFEARREVGADRPTDLSPPAVRNGP